MSEDLGAGIFFGSDFDLAVGPTGDLRNTEGFAELQKDLAMQMVISLQKYLGRGASGNIEEKVAATATRVALVDSRVEEVEEENINVTFNSSRDELTISMVVTTAEGRQELVFDV